MKLMSICTVVQYLGVCVFRTGKLQDGKLSIGAACQELQKAGKKVLGSLCRRGSSNVVFDALGIGLPLGVLPV